MRGSLALIRVLTAAVFGAALLAPAAAQAEPAPLIGVAAAGSMNSVVLTWPAVLTTRSTSQYRIYRSTSPGFTPAEENRIATVPRYVTSYVDSGRPDGTYYYRVLGTETAGTVTEASEEASAIVDADATGPDTTPPALSTALQCDRGYAYHDYLNSGDPSGRLTFVDDRGGLTWWYEIDGVVKEGPHSYQMGSYTSFNPPWEFRGASGLSNGQHVVTLRARDAAGNDSRYDCRINVYNPTLTVAISGVADGDTISGTVSIVADGLGDGVPLGPYEDYYATLSVGPSSAGWSTTSGWGQRRATWDTTKVPNGTYTITAGLYWMDYGRSWDDKSIQVRVENHPAKPTGVTAAATGDDVHVAWDAAPTGSGVTGYRVHRSTSAGFTPSDANRIGTVTGTSFDDTDPPGGRIYYRVVAVNGGGEAGDPSDEASIDLSDTTAPTVSTAMRCDDDSYAYHDYILGGSSSGGATRMTWSDDRPGFRVWYEIDGTPKGPGPSSDPVMTSTTTSFTDMPPFEFRGPLGMSNGWHVVTLAARDAAGNETRYDCRIKVYNSTLTVGFTTPSDGATVSGTITIDGDLLEDGGPPHNFGYAVVSVPGAAGVSRPGSDYSRLTWDTTKTPNRVYTIKGEAWWMDYGTPMGSGSIQVTVENHQAAPNGVTATVTGDDVRVAWDAVSSAASYRVYRSTDAGFTPSDADRIGTVTGTSFDDRDRPDGTFYYRVVAVNGGGEVSDPSDAASATVAVDRTPPAISLQASCDGRALSDYVGPINASVSDDRGGSVSTRVEVDGTAIFGPQDLSGSFSFYWDTRKFDNGAHTMTVVARDAAGNEARKDCPWTVSNKALSVPVTGVADGATVSGTVNVGFAPLGDGQPVTAGVRLLLDGTEIARSALAPYTLPWDTTKVANGLHTLKAEMSWLDYPSPLATSTIQVTVNNAPPPPAGLVAAYGFEEASGTAVTDVSGTGNTGTISGATRSAAGKFGRALSFDGVNDIVTAKDANSLDLTNGMTLEAWVKPSANTGWRTAVFKERAGGMAYSLYGGSDTNRPSAHVTTSAEFDTRASGQLPLNTWTHLAATYDGAELRIYVDGTLASTKAVTGSMGNSTKPLDIGGNKVWSEWFKGLIDEVRVYNRALSAAQIQADRDRPVS